MECKNVPPAPLWAEASHEEVEGYRMHLQVCVVCRNRVFFEAPDMMLHELQERELPEEFWTGFWPSLRSRRLEAPLRSSVGWSTFRWTAVLVLGLVLSLQEGTSKRTVDSPTGSLNMPPTVSISSDYPLLEELQNPGAKYLILQQAKNETIIMVFDPDMEL